MMVGSMGSAQKVTWSGRIVAVQPRIRLTRSFDERSHSYLGYILRIDGTCGGEAGEFLIAVGEGAHVKHRFQTGMELIGFSVPVDDQRKETAALYKTSGLKVVKHAEGETPAGPPFIGVPPDLETYRARGHRRLDARTYDTKCTTCIWGCRMPVEGFQLTLKEGLVVPDIHTPSPPPQSSITHTVFRAPMPKTVKRSSHP